MMMFESAGGERLPAGFLELPAAIYRDDPRYIPEDPDELRALFGSDNPWFGHGVARAFCIPGRARAAAFRPHGLAVAGRPAALFGFWDSAGDQDANAAVIARVRSWAAAHGAVELYGPANFSTALAYRLRLSAHDRGLPFPGEPYNPPCYANQLEALGLRLVRRYVTQIFHEAGLRALAEHKLPIFKRLERQGYSFERLEPDRWQRQAGALLELANAVFAENFAFTPLTSREFGARFGSGFAARLTPEGSVIAYGPDGELAGICLTMPHYGPLVAQAAGTARVRTSDLCCARHAAELARHGPPSWVLKTIGTSPAHRRRGVADAMVGAMLQRGLRLGLTTLFGALIREDNPSRRLTRGHQAERWYGLYRAPLSGLTKR
jgi:ribosomal protein S18 acetylase RimI-like enzyme